MSTRTQIRIAEASFGLSGTDADDMEKLDEIIAERFGPVHGVMTVADPPSVSVGIEPPKWGRTYYLAPFDPVQNPDGGESVPRVVTLYYPRKRIAAVGPFLAESLGIYIQSGPVTAFRLA